jgi:acyl-CoA synthetase (AMP-forming)/AMP-acid ligase II
MFPAQPSPSQVEAVLRRHPCVWDAAAVEVTDRGGQQVMAAVVQLAAPLASAVAELAEYCRVRLPASQVPARWVVTGSGPDDAISPSAPLACARRPAIPRQAHRAPHLET